MLLSDVIAAHHFADDARLSALIAEARDSGTSLAGVLVDRNVCDEQRLAQLAAAEAGLPFVDLAAESFDSAALALIPDDFARDKLAVALGFDAERSRVRVALADPFDAATLEALQALTGAELDPVVATVSALRAILDWDFGTRSQVSRKSIVIELDVEDTRRIAAPLSLEIPASTTSPAVRVDEAASVEQRIDALVLALIEAGVITRASYLEALERLLERHRGR